MKTMTSLVLVDIIQENACSFQFVENLHLKSNDLSSVISQGQSTRLFKTWLFRRLSICYQRLNPHWESRLWLRQLIPPVPAFPAADERLKLAVVPSHPLCLLAMVVVLRASVFAVLVDHLHFGVAECPHDVLGVEGEGPHGAGPGPRGPFFRYDSHRFRI